MVKVKGAPYIHIDGVFIGIFRKKYDRWFTFNSGMMEYPN
jgi:hypothetical protein